MMCISLWQWLGWTDYGEYWILVGLTVALSLVGIVLSGVFQKPCFPSF